MPDGSAKRMRRIINQMKAARITQKELSTEAGVDPSQLNKIIDKIEQGIGSPRPETVDKIEPALNQLLRRHIEKLVGPAPLTPEAAEKAFLIRLSDVVQEDVVHTPADHWQPIVTPDHYAKIVPICAETLNDLDAFTAGKDFAALFRLMDEIISLLEAAHFKSGSVETRTILFNAHTKAAHWHCFIDNMEHVRANTARHVARMEELQSHFASDRAMRAEQLLAWKGDSLKIAGGNESTLNDDARRCLEDSIAAGCGVVRQYQGARSLAMAAALSRLTDAEVDKALSVATRAAERAMCFLTRRVRAHLLAGISEANAERYAQNESPKYARAAKRSYERADGLWKEAEGVEPPHHELAVRQDGLKIKLARCGIPEFLEDSGMTLAEALRKQLKAAHEVGSTRIVRNSVATLRTL